MRKLIALSFMTLDGVVQEDSSGGFTSGEWTLPFWDDFLDQTMLEQMSPPFDLVFGRKMYEAFAVDFPHQNTDADFIVVSLKPPTGTWPRCKSLTGATRRSCKAMWSRRLPSSSSKTGLRSGFTEVGTRVQMLLRHDLVDELWVKIFPITLGMGKHLFVEGTLPAAFPLREVKASPRGVIVASYECAGAVQTRSSSS